MCMARSVVVAFAYENSECCEPGSDAYKEAKKECKRIRFGGEKYSYQTKQALTLSIAAGIDPNRPTTNLDIFKAASSIQRLIKVIDNENLKSIERYGVEFENQGCIYLLRTKIYSCMDKNCSDYKKKFQYHFDAIVNTKMFFRSKFYCTFCDESYEFAPSHKCKDVIESGKKWCSCCFSRKCSLTSDQIQIDPQICNECGEESKNERCLSLHKKLKVCDQTICFKCHSILKKKKRSDGLFESAKKTRADHECKIFCSGCLRIKKPNKRHKCFMTRVALKKRCSKILFLDYETDQSSGEHTPIYCFMKWIEFEYDGENQIEKIVSVDEKEFGVNYGVVDDVGDFLFSNARFMNFTIIAHNMKGFDGCFLLQYLIRNNISVSIVPNGLKLTSIFIPSLQMRIIDSLNFLQMPLSAIPRAMGIEDKVRSKGHFPHFFSTPENLNFIGDLPDPNDYGISDIEKNPDFQAWYENTKKKARETGEAEFDFQRDIRIYCKQDVVILMEGCLKFRELILKITSEISDQADVLPDDAACVALKKKLVADGEIDSEIDDPEEFENFKPDSFDPGACDPFSYLTAPGMCFGIFKGKFLKKRSVAQINPAGYENCRYSIKGCEYIEFLNIRHGKNIIHALNSPLGTEYRVADKFRVDGFDKSSKTVYEFHGCFWHGCPKCIPNRNDLQPVRKVSYQFLYEETMKRQREIIAAMPGCKVVSMWECEWEKMKKLESVKKIVENIHFKTRLNPRDSFQGGRVETSRIYYDRFEKGVGQFNLGLHYFDICSLYPSVNCFESYPVGHPKIITSNLKTDISGYFGLIQCSVIAPKNLRHAVLPVHVNNKLLFPLCRTCAEKKQIEPCNHSDDERMFHGVWVSEELKLAVREGYEIVKMFCVHHFDRQSNELFRDYIRTFYKLKLTASGRPVGETAEELEEFLRNTEINEGIKINPEDFEFNPGLRMVGKLCCNCLWGRMGMRDVFHNISLCYDMLSLNEILANQHNRISTVRCISENCVAVLFSKSSVDILNFTNNTNIYLAVFTTAYARMRLFSLIKKIGPRVIYTDTDSIFYEISPNPDENLQTGQFLGQLTNELSENEVIDEFVSGGPKVYAYKTSKGKVVVKVKGFQLNATNSVAFSFENLKRIILTQFEKNFDSNLGRMRFEKLNVKDLREKLFQRFHEHEIDASSADATDQAISVYDASRIKRDLNWSLLSVSEQKIYSFYFDKRIILGDRSCVPFGFVE